jgi:hypothetical protein
MRITISTPASGGHKVINVLIHERARLESGNVVVAYIEEFTKGSVHTSSEGYRLRSAANLIETFPSSLSRRPLQTQ